MSAAESCQLVALLYVLYTVGIKSGAGLLFLG